MAQTVNHFVRGLAQRGVLMGAIFIALFGIWFGCTITTGDLARPSVPIIEVGSGFEGDLVLPKERNRCGFECGAG